MTGLISITHETFLLLRRDRIFLPALAFGLFFIIVANLASDWSVEDFTKILFDFGAFGFRLVGISVAVFWGTKLLTDSRSEGSIELALAAPVSRSTWLLGRFLGLTITLLLLAAILLLFWQIFMILNDYSWLTRNQLLTFAFLTLEWIVCGAVAIFFACFTSNAVSLFATAATILVGLTASLVAFTMTPEHSRILASLVTFISTIWNLQLFNMVDTVTDPLRFPAPHLLWWRAAYGATAVGLLLTGASLIFARKDVGA